MERKILNFEQTLTKAQKTIQRAEKAIERSGILERDLIMYKQQKKDLQREIYSRKEREKWMGIILLLSNICWLILFILLFFVF